MHPLTNAGEQKDDATNTAGASNAASVDLGDVTTKVDVFVDVSGAADLTVEVSTDGSTWRQWDSVSYSAAATDQNQYDVAYEHVRAYVSANANVVEVVGRGI